VYTVAETKKMTSTGSIPENIRYLTGIPDRLFDFLSIHFFAGLFVI
jgi:hypothetical protein